MSCSMSLENLVRQSGEGSNPGMRTKPSPLMRDEEPARLAALHRLHLMDTRAEPAFDRITHLAQKIFGVPIALVSLIDADRQWFKSRCGLEAEGTPREQAFCDYTIRHDSVFVVPDARADRRFSGNLMVTGDPFIRFYAGAPLSVRPGLRIGSLCIIDTRPRDLRPEEMGRLAGLAAMIVGEIWMRGLEGEFDAERFDPQAPAAEPFGSPEASGITGAQLRAARALLNWSIAHLAAAARVSPTTIKRIEAGDGRAAVRGAISASIRTPCAPKGVSFIGSGHATSSGARLSTRERGS